MSGTPGYRSVTHVSTALSSCGSRTPKSGAAGRGAHEKSVAEEQCKRGESLCVRVRLHAVLVAAAVVHASSYIRTYKGLVWRSCPQTGEVDRQ